MKANASPVDSSTPTLFGKIFWVSNGGRSPSEREKQLINGLMKHAYPHQITVGTALKGKDPEPLLYANHLHLAAKIRGLQVEGDVVFVAEDANLPEHLLADGLYIIERESVFRKEGGRSILVWPKTRG